MWIDTLNAEIKEFLFNSFNFMDKNLKKLKKLEKKFSKMYLSPKNIVKV
jgi:hypothetical protein